ncbi:MAG: phosphoribosylglycinamide formyltransferase [Treponema sp. GWB1_62_6]|nr:MAG: phosphoribosylglycinamide formyltransferase [Treponema sp. GWC1_61_84]OHE67895.1 MAG: phosphoribosylglycinamide formyltransferase [Treponema sp. GWB1_62_6]
MGGAGGTGRAGSTGGPLRLLVLVSGGGTNLQALIDAEKAGKLGNAPELPARDAREARARIAGVVSDRSGVHALARAADAGIPSWVEEPNSSFPKAERRRELSDRILARAFELDADFIVLAGFLSILEGPIIDEYSGRMINLHPALLPKYGGEGMYGERVHRAVLEAGETESGCTVHLVDSGTDTGEILLRRRVPVLPGDTVETLAGRIHAEEHIAIVDAVALLAERYGRS